MPPSLIFLPTLRAFTTKLGRLLVLERATAAVLACRKLLMNIAVNKGAPTNKKFIEYVEYLSDKNYVPPDGKHWVDHIREKGNEATHEIAIMSADDAKELIEFAQMSLRFVYEFPNRVPRKVPRPSANP